MNQSIRRLFVNVPQTYELVNHLLTLGLDIRWRRRAAGLAASQGGHRWLDVCSGTGEMAACLRRLSDPETMITAVDFSLPMLSRIREKPEGAGIRFIMAEAGRLPFPDGSVDLVTISFATRNLNTSRQDLTETFGEFHRVLKPGGRLVSLETSQPPLKPVRWLVHTYVRLVVKPVGSTISGSKSPYAYLSRTIRSFYRAEELAGIIGQAGFREVGFTRLTFGAAAVHRAVK